MERDVEPVVVRCPSGEVRIGGGAPLAVIAGPCLLETAEHAVAVCRAVRDACAARGLGFVFKASFDKANRTRAASPRGPGLEAGLEMLARVRAECGVPVTTDVHEPAQAAPAGRVVDLLQVPAFLCRQTDLLVACGRTGKPVHVKKGQFMAPEAMAGAVEKARAGGAPGVLLAERGTFFGYGDLVVDLRSLVQMRALGVPVCLDATHAVQRPGAAGSAGDRRFVPALARAGAAVGIDALFLEVHEAPDRAPSDGANMVPLDELGALLDQVVAIDAARRAVAAG